MRYHVQSLAKESVMSASLLCASDLSKHYRQREMDVHVLDRLSFALDGGSCMT